MRYSKWPIYQKPLIHDFDDYIWSKYVLKKTIRKKVLISTFRKKEILKILKRPDILTTTHYWE